MNLDVNDLVNEIGRLHIQVMAQQRLIDQQQAKIVELTPKPAQPETPKA